MRITPVIPLSGSRDWRGMRDIWEMSVTKSYRITFQRESEIVLLRNIGTH
jgi:hypothetical protein